MLSDKIWITRKTRIYSERRLQNKAILSQMVIVFHSFLLLAFSIWNLNSPSNNVNFFAVLASLVILITSVFLYSQRFIERALSMRNCHLYLDKLYHRAKRIESSNNAANLEDIESQYAACLQNVENHSEYDYLCFRHSLRYKEETTIDPFGTRDHLEYYWAIIWRLIVSVLAFTTPLIIWILWKVFVQYVSVN